MRVCTLASGSSGNSLYIEAGNTKILVDAGISLRQTKLRLEQLGVELSDIDAVVITHEHTDHTHAIKRLDIPTYVASATVNLWKDQVAQLLEFESDTAFAIKDMLITPFSVSHDAIDPVGFTVESPDDCKIGIVTDIGRATPLVNERLKNSNILVVEFNHDDKIIMHSHYPWDLKQRIQGNHGHLSNTQASELLNELVHNRLKHVILAHLSKVNNTKNTAIRYASRIIKRHGAESEINISVAPRKTIGEVVQI